MYGFRISIGKKADWRLSADEYSFARTWSKDSVEVTQWSLRKFEKDKLWLADSKGLLAVEGVLFNREEIVAQPDKPVGEWRGSFAAVRVNAETQEVVVYNDPIGSHLLFWCETKEGVWVSSDLFELARVSGKKEPDETFMQRLLDYGYGHDERTFVQGICRLGAGQCLRICDGKAQVVPYHRFSNTPFVSPKEDAVARANKLFRQAVERVVRKNEEYGYRQIYPLSGGLDSRMVQTVARQLTRQPITNFTYSQTGHDDHLLPQQISRALGNEWQFIPLDGGDYLVHIDEITQATQALLNYNAPSESWFCATQVDLREAGVVATGVNGDNIFSVITDSKHELGLLYSLSFAGNGIGSPLVYQQFTETYSPFCDVDVLEYVLRIPLRKRWNYRFYDEWILRYYPAAAQWLHKGEQIGHRRTVLCLFGRHVPLRDLVKRSVSYVLRHTHLANPDKTEGFAMTPYDEWVRTNDHLRETTENYYAKHKKLLEPYPRISERAAYIMAHRPFYDRCAVLTLLSALQQL